MKFTLSWLKEHLDTEASAQAISEALTALGLEVEDMTDYGQQLAAFTVAHIVSAERHHNAEKLQICKVQTDTGELQIVCGAANARAGLKVVLAKEGTVIPANGMKIKKTAIRGVDSTGMLCSEEELGLADSSEGIIELPETAEVGAPAARVLGMDDVLFDIAITPNRADALGVYGIARDLAAAGIGTLKALPETNANGSFASPINVQLTQGWEENCPQFIGCYIKGVKNRPSPEWLQRKLTAIGLRPISALVDITNYMTMTYARPLHVFDADKLGKQLTARSAKAGETLAALNDKAYELTDGMTVIADEANVLGIAGIVGGEPTGCTEDTQNVFLEAAYFNPVNIAMTGRVLQIDSDARYRFERGVDAGFTRKGAEIAVKLIQELCGGEASEFVVAEDAAHLPKQPALEFSPSYVQTLGGVSLDDATIAGVLEKTGFHIEKNTPWKVTAPSFRPDVSVAADLVEEVLRVTGYNAIEAAPLPAPQERKAALLTPLQKRIGLTRRALATAGLRECYGWSFVSEKEAQLFGGQEDGLTLANPISEELSVMRPSVLPGLLAAATRNTNRGYKDINLFEIGPAFLKAEAGGQVLRASGLRSGFKSENNYTPYARKERSVDVFDAKADALTVLAVFGITPEKVEIVADAPAWYHPGRSGRLTLGKKITLGWFGELHPSVVSAYDLRAERLAAFEINLSDLPLPKQKGKSRGSLQASDFQAVGRDFAFLVPLELPVSELLKSAAKADDKLVQNVSLFDVYTGKGVAEDQKSVAIQVRLQAADRTLTDEEINSVCQKIIDASAKHCQAQLRA